MSIEAALFSRLNGFAGLTALVSDRIYPVGEVPQEVTKPYISFFKVNHLQVNAMGDDPDLQRDRFQINSHGVKLLDIVAVNAQVKLCLNRWSGTEAGVVIQDTFLENEIDLNDPITDTAFRAADYAIHHEG